MLGFVQPPIHPSFSLLNATLPCTVGTDRTARADLDSNMAFGAPSWALHGQHELQLAFQLPFQSAPDLQNHQFSLGKQWFLQGGAVCCPIALGLLFRSSWTSLGRLWSPTWSVLGSSWSVLGASWSVLGSSWTSLEPNLEPLGRLLERLEQLLERLGLQLDLQAALQGLQDGLRSSKLGSAQPT